MLNKKTNLILISTAMITVILMVSFLYFLNTIKNKNKHISAVALVLNQKISEKNNIGVLEKKMVDLENIQRKIDNYLVKTSSIDTFVEYLENTGVENNIELTVKSVDSPKNEKNKVVLTINMLGDYSDILKVIGILENSNYNLMITSFYINKEIVSSKDVEQQNKDLDKNIPEKLLWQASLSFSALSI